MQLNVQKKTGIYTISLTGFDGGLSRKISDINLHVDSKNYGIIEFTSYYYELNFPIFKK